MRRFFSARCTDAFSAATVIPLATACLRSALAQRYIEHIELIVVDDESTDHSLARIETIVRESPPGSIKLIAQANRGVSAARNVALAHAHAPYIGFLDSDDVWSPDFSDKIIPLLQAGTADIIEFNVSIIDIGDSHICSLTLIDPETVGYHDVGDAELFRLLTARLPEGRRFPLH